MNIALGHRRFIWIIYPKVFINEISDLCEKVGANVSDVSTGIGLDGRIGKKLISRSLAFDTKVYIYDPYVDEKIIKEFGGIKVDKIENGLKIADYVSLHMPLTNETKNLINYTALKTMKKDNWIVCFYQRTPICCITSLRI